MINSARMIILLLFAVFIVTAPTANVEHALVTNQCFSDLTQSNISDVGLLVWAQEAAVAAFTYDFVNYETELQTTSNYFTPDGWKEFYKALVQSNNLVALKAKKLLITAVATRAPIILQAGIRDGRYTWRVEMPLLVSYQNNIESTQQSLKVTMLIARASPYEGVRGLGIIQFVGTSLPQEEGNSN